MNRLDHETIFRQDLKQLIANDSNASLCELYFSVRHMGWSQQLIPLSNSSVRVVGD